ncbi:MAG: hypothetical protein UX85_C0005G0075 [Candidatus Beckwithbacteria bacterium GW2011_GWB1_47_15]|uniref:DUF11 domain-containing protein n=1 Tax=Candidatus Beckwithbacteria bacterium GW2011_GWB1_47_15 TaxID=1618371 RepID=A0A0G1RV60_9BACT|nr:MAG: hypothetical protein UY43_C0001G0805 [Candidatus Beckwithbacteria bacterium GW2011_GWC1_49_16]KKU35783.1 MAG: hypothetical protein UX50_C0002G0210 [Candidatus Beckwithbacteria bacterium GW2011_GWA1_46_30]KKU61037.1 MAG: hypothetical protein UX85_C0005G0075 [Candidatus Beckwithbacteria bacterium GW2011_GWB1_47_15]KKU72342.1 MAG: hypothetical protein UX97_C0001G0212 [Candidatus Beckwithbacteria bacterium GW2011_GWA2_47_25]KKW04898.1 MAG: hypothetical protein UY37_C0001G0002 [Candidatus Be
MKKLLAIILILLLTVGPMLGPMAVYADEAVPSAETEETVEPESSPEPESSTTVENEAEVTNEVESTANTGENTIEQTDPSPSPSPSAEPSTEATPSAITTGDSVAVTEVENQVNSTEVNSQVIQLTINIFSAGDVDLSDPAIIQQIAEQAVADNSGETEINVVAFSVDNLAYVSNEIVSTANTGDNTIEATGSAEINTGDAYSVVSLLNQLNTTIVDSTLYLVTINVFGELDGNIILPELTGANSSSGCCDGDTQINNQAVVENQVASNANSGGNAVAAQEEAEITTGEATSVVNVVNIVNQTWINVLFHYLVVNTFGSWTGSFLGWDDFLAQAAGDLTLTSSSQNQGDADCDGCIGDVDVTNQAYLSNQISSSANTGGNQASGNSGQINSGNAYSVVSLFNLVNTTILRSTGFFGFINIFGNLTGNIGGASLFIEEEAIEATPEEDAAEGEGPAPRETGGVLEVSQAHNVGDYVLPGDTVTFVVEVKNPGGGTVYDPVLTIDLVSGGEFLGGAEFNLADIGAKKKLTITTGLVLSDLAPFGDYTAVATVTGKVGPDDEEIVASADSFFSILGFTPIGATDLVPPAQAAEETGEVLGTTSTTLGLTQEQLTRLFWILLVLYLIAKAVEEREKLALAWNKNKGFLVDKALALKSLLMALIALIKSS